MLKLARERDVLSVIDDQIGAPTGADLLADLTAHALRTALLRPEVLGTYHAVAAGQTSWHGYARHVIEFARSTGQSIKVAPSGIAAVPSSAFPTPAQRPRNSRLDSTKLQETFGFHLPAWQSGVERMLTEILQWTPEKTYP
jgi:dTDP-4-dehydrorhamnose reductase